MPDVSLRCPTCGQRARASIVWHDRDGAPHAEVTDYRCPSGCVVDAESVREIIGAQ